jgi:hypothetical protein
VFAWPAGYFSPKLMPAFALAFAPDLLLVLVVALALFFTETFGGATFALALAETALLASTLAFTFGAFSDALAFAATLALPPSLAESAAHPPV